MALTICNKYSSEIAVAVAFKDTQCPGDFPANLEKRGWAAIKAGECQTVVDGDLKQGGGQMAYWAVAKDGHKVWEGTVAGTVNDKAEFGPECWKTDEPYKVNFVVLKIGSSSDQTLNLS